MDVEEGFHVEVKQEDVGQDELEEPPVIVLNTKCEADHEDERDEDEHDALADIPDDFDAENGGEKPMVLDKLPRPVNELNCRMCRHYLVKLLRFANGGNNPSYGIPEKKPPFWPDFYWPWERLSDIHSRPRDMKEPLQYSVMMKLAIERGYTYYGHNPNTYVDRNVDLSEKKHPSKVPAPPLPPSMNRDAFSASDYPNVSPPGNTVWNGPPPKLPRPASKMNSVQARTILAKLLRYQQQGRNPVYGSPDTKPPWWPEECIRWCDMVDLRGKPPYLPDSKTYIDVLRQAVVNAIKYYGFDPETYTTETLFASKTKVPAGANFQVVSISSNESTQRDLEFAFRTTSPVSNVSERRNSSCSKTELEPSEMPPKLPKSIIEMSPREIRASLIELIKFSNNTGEISSPEDFPSWWPNHLTGRETAFSFMRSLDKFDEIGSDHSSILRGALISGYSFYGIDPNEHIEHSSEESKRPRKNLPPLPDLLPIKSAKKPLGKCNDGTESKPSIINSELLNEVTPCKVMLQRLNPRKQESHVMNGFLMKALRQDLVDQKLTDLTFVAKGNQRFQVHKFFVTSISSLLRSVLKECPQDEDTLIHFPEIEPTEMELLINVLYYGEVLVRQTQVEKLKQSVEAFTSFGLLPQGLEVSEILPDLKREEESNSESSKSAKSVEKCSFGNSTPVKTTKKRRLTPRNPLSESKVRKKEPCSVRRKRKTLAPRLIEGLPDALESLDDEQFIRWLLEQNMLPSPNPCLALGCLAKCILVRDENALDKFSWSCPKSSQSARHELHSRSINIRKGSLFYRSPESLKCLMRIVHHWYSETKIDDCQRDVQVERESVRTVYANCEKLFTALHL